MRSVSFFLKVTPLAQALTGLKTLVLMNPVTIFDINRSKIVTTHSYDMCVTSGKHGARDACIFDAVDKKFGDHSMLWLNSVSLSVDNTNVMIRGHNSVASHCTGHNPNLFIAGGCFHCKSINKCLITLYSMAFLRTM